MPARHEFRSWERLDRTKVGSFEYTPEEWAALPDFAKSPTFPSHSLRRLIERQRERRAAYIKRAKEAERRQQAEEAARAAEEREDTLRERIANARHAWEGRIG